MSNKVRVFTVGILFLILPILLSFKLVFAQISYKDRKALSQALKSGDAETVKAMVARGVKTWNWDWAVNRAAEKNHLSVVKVLVQYGASPEGSDNRGEKKPLYHAVFNNSPEMVRFLVQSGADVNIETRSTTGWTPLHYAVSNNSLALIELLMQLGANANYNDKLYVTPFRLTHQKQLKEARKILIKYGAKIDYMEGLKDIMANNNTKKLLSLFKNVSSQLGDEKKITALHHASGSGRIEIMDFFIQKGIDINIVVEQRGRSFYDPDDFNSYNGFTPLHFASYNGKLEAVKWLVSKGTEINARVGIRHKHHYGIHTNYQGFTSLQLASKNGHLELVKWFIQEGININDGVKQKNSNQYNLMHKYGYNGFTPLLLAVFHNHLDVVKFLVENGAKVRSRIPAHYANPYQGFTPLYLAILKSSLEIVEHLIKKGSDVHSEINSWPQQQGKPTLFGISAWTPLHAASANGRLDIVKLLLKYGAKVDAKATRSYHESCSAPGGEGTITWYSDGCHDDWKLKVPGLTPLFFASAGGHLDVVKFLSKKLKVNERDEKGWSPLHLASARGHLDVVRFLIQKGANKDEINFTPLHLASTYGHLETVKLLVENGADIEISGQSPLLEKGPPIYFAARSGHLHIVKFLLQSGAVAHKVATHNVQRRTPLHAASIRGHLEIVKLLLQSGSMVNAKDVYKTAPLHGVNFAKPPYRQKIMELLIKHSADVNAKDSDYLTPIQWAAYRGNIDAMNLLIKHGADLNSKGETAAGDRTQTPLLSAVMDCQIEAINLLIQNGADVDLNLGIFYSDKPGLEGALSYECNFLDDKLISKILRVTSQPKPDKKSLTSNTRLCMAIFSNNLEEAQSLLKSGVDPNTDCENNMTALHYAKNVESVKLLVKYGAKVSATNKNMLSPLYTASIWGRLSVVKSLLENGADVDGSKWEEKTPLLGAAESCYTEVIKTLLQHGANVNQRPKIKAKKISSSKENRKENSSDQPELTYVGAARRRYSSRPTAFELLTERCQITHKAADRMGLHH